MKNYLVLFIKWIVVWVANVIPWVSGWTMAVMLWIFKDLLEKLSNPFKDFKNNLKFLIPLFIWVWAWILLFANLISYLITKYEWNTKLFFIWLILGSIPFMIKDFEIKTLKNKHTSFLILGLVLIVLYWMYSKWIAKGSSSEMIKQAWMIDFSFPSLVKSVDLFFSWLIASAAMVVPGVSWSLVLVLIWEYYNILNYIKEFMVIYIWITWIWIIFWVIVAVKTISLLLKKYSSQTYYFILWIVIWSIYIIIPNLVFSWIIWVLINISCLIWGILVSYFSWKFEK